ncbi:MAG: hypothetical protein AAFZ07_20305 [Actinomycetota bacterium]
MTRRRTEIPGKRCQRRVFARLLDALDRYYETDRGADPEYVAPDVLLTSRRVVLSQLRFTVWVDDPDDDSSDGAVPCP